MKNAQIVRTKSGNRYDKAVVYGFRKRFNGILKMNNSVNSNIAEKLMAHKKGLDGVYLKPTREQCFMEFKKAIPELTLDPNERDKIKLELQEKKINELESKDHEIENLKKAQEENTRRLNYFEKEYETDEIIKKPIDWSGLTQDEILEKKEFEMRRES